MQTCNWRKNFPVWLMMAALQIIALLSFSQQDTGKTRQILIKNADELFAETVNGDKIQRLVGKVAVQHEGSIMYCDSATFNTTKNSLVAVGRIHIEQGDTLDLYGDKLDYDGNTKVAQVTGRVRLIDPTVNLTTTRLVYDRVAGSAYYSDSAVTISNKDRLRSQKGYYYTNTSEFAFKGNVVIENPEYTIYTDTLIHNTKTDVAYFKGPTEIVSEDSYIYCENGWYDKKNDKCQFNQHAYVTSENNIMRGDSLYYERKEGYGKAIGNISIEDTVEDVIVTGNFAESFRNIEKYIVTDSAQLIQIFDDDSLFLHADTLYATQDTLKKRLIQAYYGVRFFKSDLQGICDSLTYSQRDSILRMFTEPVLWSEANQITSDSIEITISDGKIYKMEMRQNSLIISEVDSVKYNQIAGIDMDGYFTANELSKINVFGNGQTIYYPKEDDTGDIIGLNEVVCTDLVITITDKEVSKIVFLHKPVGTLHPLEEVNPADFRLEGFEWNENTRPVDRYDIFRMVK